MWCCRYLCCTSTDQQKTYADAQCGVAGTCATRVTWWTARAAAAHAHRCAMPATIWSIPHTPGSSVTAALVCPGMSCVHACSQPMPHCGGLPLHTGAKSGWQRSSKATLPPSVSFVDPFQSAHGSAQWRADISLSYILWCNERQGHMHAEQAGQAMVSACSMTAT